MKLRDFVPVLRSRAANKRDEVADGPAPADTQPADRAWDGPAAPAPPPPLEAGQGAWFNVRPDDDQPG